MEDPRVPTTNKPRPSTATSNVYVSSLRTSEAKQSRRWLLALSSPLNAERTAQKNLGKTAPAIEAPRETTSNMAADEEGDQVDGMAPCT